MKRIIVSGLCAGLCMAGLSAEAAPKPPKPIPMTYYFHGSQPLGEVDPGPASSAYKTMDATAPSGAQAKSQQILNYVGGPNTACAGNSLFPLWVGNLSGEVTGPMNISFSAIGIVGSVEIRVFQDIEASSCNDAFPKVAGSVVVPLPTGPGRVEATIKSLKLKPKASFMIQFSPQAISPDQGRILYDSASDNSSVSFACIPKAPKKAC